MLNKVTLIGHLGRDPETRYMTNGDAVCNFSVATSESWTDRNSGQRQERTEWHNIIMYRKLAEIAGQYLKKAAKCIWKAKSNPANTPISKAWNAQHTKSCAAK